MDNKVKKISCGKIINFPRNTNPISVGEKVVVEKGEKLSLKKFGLNVRRFFILVFSSIFHNSIFYRFIGLLNYRLNLLQTIFIAYGASEEYTKAYFFQWHRQFMRWNPWLVGLFKQNGKWGLMLGITTAEEDFRDPNDPELNKGNMQKLLNAAERIRCLTGAKQVTFAGILPGVMCANGLRQDGPEVATTVQAVIRAERKLRAALDYSADTPLIILGGKGFVGRKLIECLRGRRIH